MMIDYRRNLPHWFPAATPIFITWRLANSLPAEVWKRLKESKNARDQFRKADVDLDHAKTGPLWLKQPEIAACIESALCIGQERDQFDVHAYVIMANHVHLLISPHTEVRKITNILKGVTSRQANIILDRVGQPFWQQESFDHWIRDPARFLRTKTYIENNPVKAGLVNKAEDWRWSSANPRSKVIQGARNSQHGDARDADNTM